MNENYTAEDFARANLATRGDFGVARRTDPIREHQWHVYGAGYGWFTDEEMATWGWEPVVESRVTEHTLRDPQEKAARKREKLVDHIADQDRVIRRRNDEITALRLELADAQAPLSLDSLAAAWEAAEQSAMCRTGDVLITRFEDDGSFTVFPARADGYLSPARTRILSRAPQREPWADLADVFKTWDYPVSGYEEELAKWVYAKGVRVAGGDEK